MILFNVPRCLLTYGYGGEVWFDTCWGNEPAPAMLKVGEALLGGICTLLFHALLPIVTTLLYYDLRVADEGFELELRAAVGDRPPG